MTTGINKLAIVGTIIAALVIVAPAAARLELPDGYAPPSAKPSGYSPQALKALGERSQAMAKFYSQESGYSPQAQQALGQRGQAMAKFYSQSDGNSAQALEEPRQHWQAMTSAFSTSVPDAFERAVLRHQDEGVTGDVGRTSPDVIQQPTRSLITIDSVARSTGSGTGNSSVASDDSFDWNTFGIAAGTGVLLVALLGAGLIGLRGRGRMAHP